MFFGRLHVLVVAVLLGVVVAYCPNACSGHGGCGVNDRCTCYLRPGGDEYAWQGADCSERTCPKGASWASAAVAKNSAHPTVECSDKGACDRSTGECQCFAGYEGIACERTVCPNDCSGNGFCKTAKQISSDRPANAAVYGTAWDSEKHVGCICDEGYRGPDCSLRECPTGSDVMGGHGADEFRDCAGRGICDYTTGLCTCFPGFYGYKCESQTILG
ncbi:unnamed protein product [Chrysoparadoxa australica]